MIYILFCYLAFSYLVWFGAFVYGHAQNLRPKRHFLKETLLIVIFPFVLPINLGVVMGRVLFALKGELK